jgi:hypothetical protein
MTKIFAMFVLLIGISASVAAKDRALLIGIDRYQDQFVKKLEGCENDTKLLQQFLTTRLGFKEADIKILVNSDATEAKIGLAVQEWLVRGTQPGDRVFFAYSGHGTQIPDQSGDEYLDGVDEALAVYDVKLRTPLVADRPAIPLSGYILDDEVSHWVSELAGRQVVMVFDSCHSGTISRGLDSSDGPESRFLRANLENRPAKTIYSPDYNKNPQSRSLENATEGFLDGKINGVVIISAAHADQEAFPIVDRNTGKLQGALTDLFVTEQSRELIPVGRLQDVLVQGMRKLQTLKLLRPGRSGQYQIPQVELHIQHPALPIFGGSSDTAWTAGPESALFNPLSHAKVEIWTTDGGQAYSVTKPNAQGQPGETIHLAVRTNEAGYLYMWVFSEGDVAKCVYPWPRDPDNKVGAGTYTFPRCIGGAKTCGPNETYEFYASRPVGRDVWVALLTDAPLVLEPNNHEYRWSEAFARIGLAKLQSALTEYVTRATSRSGDVRVVTAPSVTAWQAGSIVLRTYE